MTWSVLIRVAGVAAATVATAACSDNFARFGSEPMYTASTDNQREILGYQGASATQPLPAATAPQTAVTATTLPPPTLPAAPVASAAPMAAAPAVEYRGWSSAGGTTVVVAQGETASSMSRRYGVPEEALLATNRLSSPSQLTPGRQVVIPTYSVGARPAGEAAVATAAPVGAAAPGLAPGPQNLAAQAPAVPPSGPPETHRVAPGETLNSISRTYGVPAATIVAANDLPNSNAIRIGQVLRIPGGQSPQTRTASLGTNTATDAVAVPAAAPVAPVATTETPAAAKPAEQQVAMAPTSAATAGKTMTDAVEAQTSADAAEPEDSASGFRWPARGRVIAGFGRKSSGEQNDGINIALPEGTPIKASESGTVIYAGNELSGFGNLLLIRHENGWVTAYAHNKELLVGRGATVKRGQVIAYAGATGSVTQPQLHFELRKGSQPVDPLPHLSGA